MAFPITPTMARFLNPPARLGAWPQDLFNDGRFERESARIEERRAVAAVGRIAVLVGKMAQREPGSVEMEKAA
jgi:hypothetical protein